MHYFGKEWPRKKTSGSWAVITHLFGSRWNEGLYTMFQGWLVVVIGTYNYSAISAFIPRVFSGGNLLQFFGQGLYGRDGTS